MSHPSSLLQRAVLQPRVANGYTTFCGVNGDGTRLAVGWDTGSERGVSTFVTRPGWPEGCRGTSWEEIPDLDLTADLDGELNAIAMDADGMRIACGDSYNSRPAGAVCIYEFSYAMDAIAKVATLTPSGGVADEYFGAACCFNQSGTRLYVGAPGYDNDAGAVYIFDLVGAAWVQSARITLPGTEALGTAVAVNLDETLLAVGAQESDYFTGGAYILAKVGGVFQLRDTIEAGDYGGAFGSGIALSPNGTRLYVGAPHWGDTEARQGVIVTLDYANGTWSPRAAMVRAAPWGWENLGLNLALSHYGCTLVAGLQATALVYDARQYAITGHVLDDNGQPAERRLSLHDGLSCEVVDVDLSSTADGSFMLAARREVPHFIVCHDDHDGVTFNHLITGGVIPL